MEWFVLFIGIVLGILFGIQIHELFLGRRMRKKLSEYQEEQIILLSLLNSSQISEYVARSKMR